MRRFVVLLVAVVMASVFLLAEPPAVGADNDTCGDNGTTANDPYNRPDGQFIQWGGTQGVVQGCQKRGFTDPTSRDTHRLDGPPAVISEGEAAALPSGPALLGREGTVIEPSPGLRYIVDETGPGSYRLRYIQPSAWNTYFASCGSYPTIASSSYFARYGQSGPDVVVTNRGRPDGQLIRNPAGTIFVVNGNVKKGFPSWPAFASYNFQWPTCNVSDAEAGQYPTGNCALAREGTLARDDRDPVYVIDYKGPCSSEKRHIAGLTSFGYYGYSWANVRVWSRSETGRYGNGPHAHPVKTLWPDRWYKRVEDSGSYLTWMTLSEDRHYGGGLANVWSTPTSNALNAWNDPAISPNTVYLADYPPATWHDIHVWVTQNGCAIDPLVDRLLCAGSLGRTFLFDELLHDCWIIPPGGWEPTIFGDCDALHSRPNTWWYAIVMLDHDEHVRRYGNETPQRQDFQRKATTVHELGHAIALRHDPVVALGEIQGDGCGPPAIPRSVMDADCTDAWLFNDPQPWDSCGINHAYPDPNVGWAGC